MGQPVSTELNTEALVLWFDDLGTGNEAYRFLSNFYAGDPIVLPGVTHPGTDTAAEFQTGEHAFQALKTTHADEFLSILEAEDPNEAKYRGRTCTLRPDWEEVKYDVMCAVVRAKFTLRREEGLRLLETGDKLLVEGTYWNDSVWGVDLKNNGIPGRNWLGTILMARRAELRAMKQFDTDSVNHFATVTGLWNTKFGAVAWD